MLLQYELCSCHAAHILRCALEPVPCCQDQTLDQHIKSMSVYDRLCNSESKGRVYPHMASRALPMCLWLLVLQTLFHKGRFRQEPYEWVYDGLKPLDMMDVFQTNKGISLTLAVSFLGIAGRLGIPMSMVPIPEGIATVLTWTAWHHCILLLWHLHAHAHFLQASCQQRYKIGCK